jgi:phosphatidylglycerophosphate synthase
MHQNLAAPPTEMSDLMYDDVGQSEIEDAPSPQRQVLELSDFKPHGAVSNASWPTRCVAYPMGVRVAYACYLLGLAPNFVSILSLVIGIGTVVGVGFYVDSQVWQGVLLLVGLQLAYVFDCADGVLARATGKCSAFGSIFDKTLDCVAMILIPGVLCTVAPRHHEMNMHWVGPLILLSVVPNVALAMVIWLKDYVRSGGSKTTIDQRQRTPFWYAARAVAFFLDTPMFRLVLTLAWISPFFVESMICLGAFSTLALIVYLVKAHQEFKNQI